MSSSRFGLCFGLLMAGSCRDADRTWLGYDGASSGLEDVTVEEARSRPSSVVDGGSETVEVAAAPTLHDAAKGDAGTTIVSVDAAPNPDAPNNPPECGLRVSWGAVSASAADCTSLSAAFDTTAATWDGGRLSFIGATWSAQGDRLERRRVCTRRALEQWRFRETLEFPSALPGAGCWVEPVTAAYQYTECPQLNSGLPCRESSACTFDVLVTFTPDSAVSTAEPGETPEPDCADPKPLGAACSRLLDCADGGFCSRQLDETTCTDLGAGTCQPAPVLDCPTNDLSECTCDGRPVATEPVCSCDGPPVEIPGLNACLLRADGETVWPCP